MPTPIYLVSSLIAVAITAILSLYAWRQRSVPGALAFTLLMAAYTEWSVAYTFNLGSPTLEAKILWAEVGYIGSATIALIWLIFTAQYTGAISRVNYRKWWWLGLLPLISVILAFTNEYHSLVWTDVWLNHGLQVAHGIWYYVLVAYSYVLSLVGMGMLVRQFVRSRRPYRSQAGAIIIGGLITWIWNILYLYGPSNIARPEFTPGVITLSGVAFAWGLFRYRLLDVVPVAREVVIESMSDGMLVLDNQDRVIDLNPAAQGILGYPASHCIGTSLSEIFPAWNDQISPTLNGSTYRSEIAVQTNGKTCYYELHISPLLDRREQPSGRLVLLTDISEQKRSEDAEREQRVLAEALRDTAAALNSTLQLDEVLDRILTNIGRVVPFDAVNIMLLEDGITHVTRSQGYIERGLEQPLREQRLTASEVPNLKTMVETNQPVTIPSVHAFSGWVQRPEASWVQSYTGAPICSRGETIGFLNLDSASPDFFTPLHAERLQAFADQAAIALQNARLYTSVQQMAMTDSLTGLYNRRALLDAGQREFEVCIRLGHPLSAIMIDVDHFKEVNDTFGHPIGDQVLRALVKYLREAVRAIDIIGRYGGDEFLIFLLENDLHVAGRVAERIRRSIARALLLTDSGSISITISLGVAAIHPQTLNLANLIENADKALYAAKHSGRNRVEQWVEPVIELPEWNPVDKSAG